MGMEDDIMSNTSQKKLDEKTLKDVQEKLIAKGKEAGGSLPTEAFAAAMAPLGADMDQIPCAIRGWR